MQIPNSFQEYNSLYYEAELQHLSHKAAWWQQKFRLESNKRSKSVEL